MRTRVFSAPKVPAVFLRFWVVKLLTTGIGETGSDFLGTVSIPLAAIIGIGAFFAALQVQLRAETYHPVRYWATVLSVALFGTAVGDATAIDFGLGFTWSILLFAVLIVVPLGLRKLGLNVTVAFWASYVLTRPLGASVADWLGKGTHDGGVGWGTGPVTGIGLLLFAALVAYLAMTHSDVDHAAVHARDSTVSKPDPALDVTP
ncbi:hypothetical protein F1D05_02550 [Kribbella qitaiheensis]|uniref:Uncharacterized protein n=1 Tax=Kribbella qitaiheensis TaxID=1544730 RepID=A0A7G6WSM7_9ACTN|nr:hypothetical protein [Kribbella qitaiheensis]QNE16992.1 hypothetical protein F1D05_02550 [Kribbella qitaiheensis]